MTEGEGRGMGSWGARFIPTFPQIHYSEWTERALCANHPAHWWDGEKGADTERAKRICRMCPVRHECLDEALSVGEPATIRGGLRACCRGKGPCQGHKREQPET